MVLLLLIRRGYPCGILTFVLGCALSLNERALEGSVLLEFSGDDGAGVIAEGVGNRVRSHIAHLKCMCPRSGDESLGRLKISRANCENCRRAFPTDRTLYDLALDLDPAIEGMVAGGIQFRHRLEVGHAFVKSLIAEV